jgi:hypothetical protein
MSLGVGVEFLVAQLQHTARKRPLQGVQVGDRLQPVVAGTDQAAHLHHFPCAQAESHVQRVAGNVDEPRLREIRCQHGGAVDILRGLVEPASRAGLATLDIKRHVLLTELAARGTGIEHGRELFFRYAVDGPVPDQRDVLRELLARRVGAEGLAPAVEMRFLGRREVGVQAQHVAQHGGARAHTADDEKGGFLQGLRSRWGRGSVKHRRPVPGSGQGAAPPAAPG